MNNPNIPRTQATLTLNNIELTALKAIFDAALAHKGCEIAINVAVFINKFNALTHESIPVPNNDGGADAGHTLAANKELRVGKTVPICKPLTSADRTGPSC